ncbi:Lon family ATP-dependent protease, partial [mine drainage metagenome]
MDVTVPLFPLPNVVLFPKTLRPLHIFEPRYRAMIAQSIAGDRLIGMMFLKDGWENQYDQNPPVEPVGCLGRIIQHNQLPDGRYYITLLGISSFDLISEIASEPFRTGVIETREGLSDELLSPALFERLANVV